MDLQENNLEILERLLLGPGNPADLSAFEYDYFD